MRQTTAALAGTLLGAGLVFALDPGRRRRRWALARDRITHARRLGRDALDATARDVSNRTRGVVAELRTYFDSAEPVPDVVLVERVRARLGEYTSHPAAIVVEAEGGRVVLKGRVLGREVQRLVRAVERVRGVRTIENHLEVHGQPDVPALQGGAPRTGARMDLFQTRWSPTTRAAAGLAGVVLVVSGAARRSLVGTLAGTAGMLLLLRAATNGGATAGPGRR